MGREAGLSEWSVRGFGRGGRGTGLNRLGGFKKGRGRRGTRGLAGEDCPSGAASYGGAFKEKAGRVGAGGALRFGRAARRLTPVSPGGVPGGGNNGRRTFTAAPVSTLSAMTLRPSAPPFTCSRPCWA